MSKADDAGPDPPEGAEHEGDPTPPTEQGLDDLRVVTLTRRLRAVEAERDSWRSEALALRKRCGVITPPDRWRKQTPGFRRVWLDENPADWK